MKTDKFFDNFYGKKYKMYLVIPVILLIISLLFAFNVPKSIDLKGGTMLTIHSETNVSESDIKTYLLDNFELKDLDVKVINRISGDVIELQYITPESLTTFKEIVVKNKELSKTDVNKALTEALLILDQYGVDTSKVNKLDYSEVKSELDLLYNNIKNNHSNTLISSLNSKFNVEINDVEIKEVGAVLGDAFYQNAVKVVLWAIVLITIVIFLFFREVVPSVAIILSAMLDVVGALAAMTLFNIPLSLITIPALLMLIGYSVDTDLMLTTRLMKRTEGTLKKRAGDAMKTGLTMTITTLVALVAMLIMSYLYNIQVMFYISAVLLSGLFVDMISTWLMNAPILIWYLESKKGSRSE